MMPYFMNRAVKAEDPVERMKYFLSAIISAFYHMNLFLKPVIKNLNAVESSHRRDVVGFLL